MKTIYTILVFTAALASTSAFGLSGECIPTDYAQLKDKAARPGGMWGLAVLDYCHGSQFNQRWAEQFNNGTAAGLRNAAQCAAEGQKILQVMQAQKNGAAWVKWARNDCEGKYPGQKK